MEAAVIRDDEVAVHLNPVWRERANFLIMAKIDEPSSEQASKKWEQLWVRQLAENVFEVCCIPFFRYHLSLGDHVETDPELDKYILGSVVKRSGNYTFRVWFGNSTHPGIIKEVLDKMHSLGCLLEFYSQNLLAISASSAEMTQTVADYLNGREELGHLEYEAGQ